ncbi:hypothetical protein VTN96DRAFT_6684 [Rasamsonia emersonii]
MPLRLGTLSRPSSPEYYDLRKGCPEPYSARYVSGDRSNAVPSRQPQPQPLKAKADLATIGVKCIAQ